MLQPTDITIMCQLNDVPPIYFWPNDVVSMELELALGRRRLKSDPWVEGKDGSSKLGHFK
jgi:hypothetical protein